MSKFGFLAVLAALPALGAAGRVTIPLDGMWEIEESVDGGAVPSTFGHKVQVPGLANLAQPPFPNVDLFDSRELINNKVRRKLLPDSAAVKTLGVPRQKRNYFWYRTKFRPSEKKAVAILRINKAQFTTSVWLNGKPVGDHTGCFTAGTFDLTPAMQWGAENELVVRVGAHPGVMPLSTPAGTDFEKLKWTPGIYDSVSLELSDNPVIESVQAAPRISPSEVLVQVQLRNFGKETASFALQHTVKEWKSGRLAARSKPMGVSMAAGESRTITTTIPIPNANLWSPESPFLYTVDSTTGGDSVSTRFGMREIRFDTATRRAYLNGKIYFLRGSNITLHRFFEDPKAGALTWNERWVRKLLIDIPKKMNWNSFRFCIGPVPQKWLDIADEAGLLIQYEYFIWTGRNEWHDEWTEKDLIREYREWMRDAWNHPSVALWDASNETIDPIIGDRVIPVVRKLDLSNRAWENGYNVPSGLDDPYEDHPYLFGQLGKSFSILDLENTPHARRANSAHPSGHAAILNEYGWIWLNRDGSPTLLTEDVYKQLMPPNATGGDRLKTWAYYLGGLTELWRATRDYAGVLHFVYLTCSFPGVFTSDHWRDVENLELDPDFADYVGQAFKPLGVYVNFWQPKIQAGSTRAVGVSLINDDVEIARGKLTLAIEDASGRQLATEEKPFEIPGSGQHTYTFALKAPAAPGEITIRATARADGTRHASPTVSRRKTTVVR